MAGVGRWTKTLEFILYNVLRLTPHTNNIGVHFRLPWHSFLVFRLDMGIARLSLFFPGFISVSAGRLARTVGRPPVTIYQLYAGLKEDSHQSRLLGEPDYLISFAARRLTVPSDAAYSSWAAF